MLCWIHCQIVAQVHFINFATHSTNSTHSDQKLRLFNSSTHPTHLADALQKSSNDLASVVRTYFVVLLAVASGIVRGPRDISRLCFHQCFETMAEGYRFGDAMPPLELSEEELARQALADGGTDKEPPTPE